MEEEKRILEINNISNRICVLINETKNCSNSEKLRIISDFIQFVDKNGSLILPIKELRNIYNIIGIDEIIKSGLPVLVCHYNILYKKKLK
jgi:hypothetical protein